MSTSTYSDKDLPNSDVESVILYENPGCGPCFATKRFMAKNGILFSTAPSHEAAEIISDHGFKAAPVVKVSFEDDSPSWVWNEYREAPLGVLAERVRALKA